MIGRFALCVAASLAACGPLNEESLGAGLADIVKTRTGIAAASSAATPEQLAAAQAAAAQAAPPAPGTVIVATLLGSGAQATLAKGGENGARQTFVSAMNSSITLERGIIVATRGFARDLMSADVSGVYGAIVAGGGNTRRTHEFLGDLDQISTELLQCSIAFQANEIIEVLEQPVQTRRFGEDCNGQGLRFANVYWVDRNNTILRSRQAVSPEVGFMQIDQF